MKVRLLVFSLLFLQFAIAQQNNYSRNIFFPKAEFSNSSSYESGIKKLVASVLTQYANAEKNTYYDNLFRLHFAQNNYAACIQYLDSFVISAVPDKALYNAFGFHYRVHCATMLLNSNNYNDAYEKTFNCLYYPLPDEGKSRVNNTYEQANPEAEKEKFTELTKTYVTGGDSITISNAINYIKQYNFWQVYSKTLPLAKQQLLAYDAYEKANKQNKLLGLDEGATIDPAAKTVITNVILVDVEKQQLLPNTTVEITGKTITAITQKINPPTTANATVIDGGGQYLMPGLTDAHIHFFQSGGLYTRPDVLDVSKHMPYEKEIEWGHLNMKDVLKRNTMNGITTVIDVGATYNLLELRDKFKGKNFAPEVYMTGPLLTTNEPAVYKNLGKDEPFSLVTTEADGIKMVQQQLPYKPDFIKIWYILEEGKDKETSAKKFLPIVKAIINESHKHKLKVAVHATERITAQLAVENGCDFLVHSIEDEIINDALIKTIKDKKVVLCPTLSVANNYVKTFGQEHDFSVYELLHANPTQLSSLYDLKHLPDQGLINSYKTAVRASKATYNMQDSICLVNLKKLVNAGVTIAAGTDAGNIGTMHGTSLLTELKFMQKSGMSNWQLLQSATINAAKIFDKEKQTGSIAAGKTADMILLKNNPVADVQNLQQINLVINKGFVIKPDTLIKETPLSLVQKQLIAYNARNIDAFLEPYADDVEIYDFPNKLLSKGKEAMRKDYAFFNTVPELHCEIKQRIIQGNIVIDKESVTGFGSSKPLEATAIYHIEGNKIKRVYFMQ